MDKLERKAIEESRDLIENAYNQLIGTISSHKGSIEELKSQIGLSDSRLGIVLRHMSDSKQWLSAILERK